MCFHGSVVPMNIRREIASDQAAIRRVHLASFPGPQEADLVGRLRDDGDAVFSLVATTENLVVGHVMLSRMTAPFRALGLAPVAVLPDWRRRGIAARLIEDGIKRSAGDDWQAVFVVGNPAYYCRFGFNADSARNFDSPYAGPYLMAVSLAGFDLGSASGRIDYAPAFAALE